MEWAVPISYAHAREADGEYPKICVHEYTGSVVIRLLHDDDLDAEDAAAYLCGRALDPW